MKTMGAPAGDTLDTFKQISESARAASDLLKALSNETRLMILCMLVENEMTVRDLEAALNMRQPAVSQQLSRLRAENLVSTRRDGKMIYYGLASSEARAVIQTLYGIYCAPA